MEEFRQKNEEGDLIGFVREFRLPDAMKEKMDEYLSALYGEAWDHRKLDIFGKLC